MSSRTIHRGRLVAAFRFEVSDEDSAPYLPISSRTTVFGAEFAIEAAEEEAAEASEAEERDQPDQ